MTYTIAITDDVDHVEWLDKKCMLGSPELSDEELDGAVWWLASDAQGGCGYGGLGWPLLGTAELTRAGVLSRARGHGLQRALIQRRLRYARQHGCTEAQTYTAAHNVYSMRNLIRCGFLPIGFSDQHSKCGSDFITFERRLGR